MNRYDWPIDTGGEESEGDDPRKRRAFLLRRRIEFDPEGALAAGRRQEPGSPGPFAIPMPEKHLWQPLGPMTVLQGQAVGRPRVAGRVNAIAVHENGMRAYAASANGGVWYTRDGGSTWDSLGGFASTEGAEITRPAHRHACGAIKVIFSDDPDPDKAKAADVVYVGTGETASSNNAQPGHSLGGIGILVNKKQATPSDPNPWVREAKNLLGRGVYRIAISPPKQNVPPEKRTVIVATTKGLFQRPDPSAENNEWDHVIRDPDSADKEFTRECTDVLWTAETPDHPERVWVWVTGGPGSGLWVRSGPAVVGGKANKFERIPLADASAGRAVLAAPKSEEHIFIFNDRFVEGNKAKTKPPALFKVENTKANELLVGRPVAGVPKILGDAGFYDMALAVDPTNPNRVVLGGQTFRAKSPDGVLLKISGDSFDGAVVSGEISLKAGKLTFGHPQPFKMVGVGVHADIQNLQYTNGGKHLWAVCDGGVFRSDNPDKQFGFFALNDGLNVVESNYIAVHPKCEGHVIAGLQDNGVISRDSNGVWRNIGLGDCGGIAFDPLRPTRFFRQSYEGGWESSDETFSVPFSSKEDKKSAFYSMPAAIAHRRGKATEDNVRQIIIGTQRVWYTENFGKTWVTLPKGKTPSKGNLKQDDFKEAITVCRWQSPDVAWILGEGKLMRYARTPGSDNAGGPGKWTRAKIIAKDGATTHGPIRESKVWTDIAVNLDAPGVPHGPRGALYLGTIGDPDNKDVDTLWWYDGTSKWIKTNLRNDPKGVPAPVISIVCDPDFPNEVYVGTTVGVWKGVRKQAGNADPQWDWEARLNGLPEAAVEDLAIFSDGGLRLLRAAIASRGVWELRLDKDTVEELTYVRAHVDDLRYRKRAVEVRRDLKTPRSWHGSPDVRPRLAPRSRPAPQKLPWKMSSKHINSETLRGFQAALRMKTPDGTPDLRVRPTGKWDIYFNEVLRSRLDPPPVPPDKVSITQKFWDSIKSSIEPWGTGTPTEADIYEFSGKLNEGELKKASCTMPPENLKVDILVHHHGVGAVNGANVRVTLLSWKDEPGKKKAKWNDVRTWPTAVEWIPAVNEVLKSASGKTNLALGAGWNFVLTDQAGSHYLTLKDQKLHSTQSGIATFDLDLTQPTKLTENTLVLLVAVIYDTTAPTTTLPILSLSELVLTNPSVAVRSIQISSRGVRVKK